MNRKPLIAAAAIALLGATSAFAQEATPDTWMQVASSKTRAQVQAELAQARADGSLQVFRAGYIETVKGAPKARAEVRAAIEAARASGELQAINGEAYDFQPLSPAAPVRLARNAR